MTEIKCNSTFGQFGWEAIANVSDEVLRILACRGMLQELQRSPASKAEKVLGGYEKRPDDFKRANIPFDTEGQRVLESHLGAPVELVAATKDSAAITFEAAIATKRHIIGEGSEPKYVEEKAIIARHVKAGDFAQWMHDKVGFDATAADADSVDVLKAVKAYKQLLTQNA